MKKIFAVLAMVMFLAVPAFAGNAVTGADIGMGIQQGQAQGNVIGYGVIATPTLKGVYLGAVGGQASMTESGIVGGSMAAADCDTCGYAWSATAGQGGYTFGQAQEQATVGGSQAQYSKGGAAIKTTAEAGSYYLYFY